MRELTLEESANVSGAGQVGQVIGGVIGCVVGAVTGGPLGFIVGGGAGQAVGSRVEDILTGKYHW